MNQTRRKERKIILRTLFFAMLLLLSAAGIKINEDVFASNISERKKVPVVYLYSNKDFDQQMQLLADQGVLRNPGALSRLLKLSGYDELIKPGRYLPGQDASNLDLMRLFVSGRQTALDVVFTGGERLGDVAGFWSRNLEADSLSILQVALHIEEPGIDSNNLIQIFVPNTYNFYWNTSAESLVKRMVREYHLFWDSSKLEKAATTGLTPVQVGVLASIVQKETAKADEMPDIAGVYLNRLRMGMPLQADPTLLFALNDKSIKRVGGYMLQLASPYNTYTNKGLPPGPICVPSVQAIEAVLNYRKHRYIYFCAREDFSGYHRFASDFAQHQRNARMYQKALNQKGIY